MGFSSVDANSCGRRICALFIRRFPSAHVSGVEAVCPFCNETVPVEAGSAMQSCRSCGEQFNATFYAAEREAVRRLVPCSDCGKEISRRADSCPNCGAPPRRDVSHEMNMVRREIAATNQSGLVIAGFLCAALALFVFPPAFGIAGAIFGGIATSRNDSRGIFVVVGSLLAMVLGMIWGLNAAS